MNITVIVPSLDPDEKLMQVVEGLLRVGFTDILLVNDGSHDDHVQPFLEAAQHPEVTVLTHEVNRGKGPGKVEKAFPAIANPLAGRKEAGTCHPGGEIVIIKASVRARRWPLFLKQMKYNHWTEDEA